MEHALPVEAASRASTRAIFAPRGLVGALGFGVYNIQTAARIVWGLAF